MKNYILVGKKTKPVQNILEWAKWFETANRVVAKTEVRGLTVSTVFLGADHSFGYGKPLLFETMIFGRDGLEYTTRCSTWGEAEQMHKEACAYVVEEC